MSFFTVRKHVEEACYSPLRKQVEWLDEHGFEFSQIDKDEDYAVWVKTFLDGSVLRVRFNSISWDVRCFPPEGRSFCWIGSSMNGPKDALQNLMENALAAHDESNAVQKILNNLGLKENHHD